jgi:hypothetical protein
MAYLAGLAMETEMGTETGDGAGRLGKTRRGRASERASGAQMQVPYVPGRTDAKSSALPFCCAQMFSADDRPLSLSATASKA